MRFAVLGTDPNVIALASAAKEAGHTIFWLGEVRPEDTVAVAQLAPAIPHQNNWEVLLDHATADAVLIGRGMASLDRRAEQLKRLATDAVPILVSHPIVESVLVYYEIDMLRRETGGVVQHFNPVVFPSLMAQLAEWSRAGHDRIGTIHQIVCERHLVDASRRVVLRYLARDAELLAAVAGGVRHVSAVGPTSTETSFASLQVQMASPLGASLRWSVAPPRGSRSGLTFILVGQHGTVAARIVDDNASRRSTQWQMQTIVGDQEQAATSLEHDAAREAVERLLAALAPSPTEQHAERSTWDKATQAMEVVDAVELSLQRGRTIEVHQQQLTERLAFRGTMAAIGCGLLTVGFLVVVLAAILGGLETVMQQPLLRPWPIVLLAVLALFLLLQAVPLLAAKREATKPAHDPGDRSKS